MRNFSSAAFLIFIFSTLLQAQAQTVKNDFEGNGSITTWYVDKRTIAQIPVLPGLLAVMWS